MCEFGEEWKDAIFLYNNRRLTTPVIQTPSSPRQTDNSQIDRPLQYIIIMTSQIMQDSSLLLSSSENRLIWFRLVDSTGHPYKEAASDYVSLPPNNVVAQFRDAVKTKYADSHLKGFAPSNIKVFKNKEAFEKNEPPPFASSHPLVGLGSEDDDKTALVVLVPEVTSSESMLQPPPPPPRLLLPLLTFHDAKRLPCADETLVTFWKGLSNIALTDGKFITFPALDDLVPRKMKRLYIRKPYADLFEIMSNHLLHVDETDTIHNFVITGTPGIGKTVFLFYVLWRLSKMETTEAVILRRQVDRGRIYVFTKNECFMTKDDSHIDLLLLHESTWYLTDTLSPLPGVANATTLLVCSPSRKHYSDFLKIDGTICLYMPLWSLNELLEVAPVYKLEVEDVTTRYLFVGGVVRYVLEQSLNLVKFINDALGRVQVSTLMNLFFDSENIVYEKLVHSIIHYEVVDSNYDDFEVRMASSYVTERLLEKLADRQRKELVKFLVDTSPRCSE